MKQYFKDLITRLLWWQVRRLRTKHQPLVIAVVGSVGKTGTKTAIATVLGEGLRVRWQDGNYNVPISAPLVFFNQTMPHIYNIFGWARVFIASERQIQRPDGPQAVVLELGADHPGDLAEFKTYLQADIGILTAISTEHMENFADLEAIAEEELAIGKLAKKLFVNTDAVDKKYLAKLAKPITYGPGPQDCRITAGKLSAELKRPVTLTLKDGPVFKLETALLGLQNLPALAAAATVACELELNEAEINTGLQNVRPLPGRMQPLEGDKQSLLIDDTYNASPEAVIAALKTLYEIPAKSKVAILGQMNELGKLSAELHEQVGELCDPKQLKLVITIGAEANKYLARAAETRGCKVMRCPSPYHAAEIVFPLLQKGMVILAKGSQNGVYAEEAVKALLNNADDSAKLVRQSPRWLKLKESQFTL